MRHATTLSSISFFECTSIRLFRVQRTRASLLLLRPFPLPSPSVRIENGIDNGSRLTWNVATAAAAIRKEANVLATLGRRFVDLRGRINRRRPRWGIPVDVDELLRFRHDLGRRFQGWPRSPEISNFVSISRKLEKGSVFRLFEEIITMYDFTNSRLSNSFDRSPSFSRRDFFLLLVSVNLSRCY